MPRATCGPCAGCVGPPGAEWLPAGPPVWSVRPTKWLVLRHVRSLVLYDVRRGGAVLPSMRPRRLERARFPCRVRTRPLLAPWSRPLAEDAVVTPGSGARSSRVAVAQASLPRGLAKRMDRLEATGAEVGTAAAAAKASAAETPGPRPRVPGFDARPGLELAAQH